MGNRVLFAFLSYHGSNKRAASLSIFSARPINRFGNSKHLGSLTLRQQGSSPPASADNWTIGKSSNCYPEPQPRRQGWKVIRIWQHSLKTSPVACLNRILRALGSERVAVYVRRDACIHPRRERTQLSQ